MQLKQSLHHFIVDNRKIHIIALVLWLFSFLIEQYHMPASPATNLFNYIVCKVLLYFIYYFLIRFLYNAIVRDDRKSRREYYVLIYALPYLLVLFFWMFTRRSPELVGDESVIYMSSQVYDGMSAAFVYLTGYYYILSFMMIPTMLAPVITKMIVQALIVGYIIYRFKHIIKSKLAFILYLFFIAFYVLDNGVTAHRLPFYGPLYLLFIAKLIFDRAEKVPANKTDIIIMSLLCAVLTWWRVEGIYLLVIGFISILLAYRIKIKKIVLCTLAVFICMQGLIVLPQIKDSYSTENYTDTRMGPFYLYIFVNMCRNGLDQEKYADELAIIDEYVSIDAVNRINNDWGDKNYEDTYIAWAEGYVGVKNYTVEGAAAIKKIILEEPKLFLKTQVGSWNYISLHPLRGATYSLTLDWSNARASMEKLLLWIVNLAYLPNILYIPLILVFFFFFRALVKKDWLLFWICGGMLMNALIVFVLKPASYFKYFYVLYLSGYFLLIIYVVPKFKRWRDRKKGKVEQEKEDMLLL